MIPKALYHIRATTGASLIVAMGLTLVLLLLAAGMSVMVRTFMATTNQGEQANAAYFAAEGGVELALYDIAGYSGGYEVDDSKSLCGDKPDLSATPSFVAPCNATNAYRLLDFKPEPLGRATSFWRIFAQGMKEKLTGVYTVPNPYFVGDKDGALQISEWGRLTKSSPIAIPLTIDYKPSQATPSNRFTYLDTSKLTKARLIVSIDPADLHGGSPNFNNSPTDSDPDGAGVRTNQDQDVAVWTMSAVDGEGNEHTLQGVLWESDFAKDCDGGSTGIYCAAIDLKATATETDIDAARGSFKVGEDINRNIGGVSVITTAAKLNRVSGRTEQFDFAAPYQFLADAVAAGGSAGSAWGDIKFTMSLIGTLSETTALGSDALIYRMEVQTDPSSWPAGVKPLADDTVHVVSEGFAGQVKQTIETSFRPETTIPVFTYAIFQ